MGSSQERTDKFSITEYDEGEEVFHELEKFVSWVSWNNSEPGAETMMDYDELSGELFLEVAKGIKHYGGKLPLDQLKAVIRKMVDNRIFELKFRYHCTHRKLGGLNISLDIEQIGFPVSDSCNVEELYDSGERIGTLSSALSPRAKRVFDAVIFGDERLGNQIKLSAIRANFVHRNPSIRIRTHLLSEALYMSEREVRSAINEIKRKYAEVMND